VFGGETQMEKSTDFYKTCMDTYALSEVFFQFIIQTYDRLNVSRDYGTGESIHMIEAHTLTLIDDHPGITVTEIARHWRRTKGTISLRVSKLEKKGFIRRQKEDGNDKAIHFYITDEGKKLSIAHKLYDSIANSKYLQHLLENCSSEEVEIFYNVLSIITQKTYPPTDEK
jgi:DNA-binding MarR family transcriptional regulator